MGGGGGGGQWDDDVTTAFTITTHVDSTLKQIDVAMDRKESQQSDMSNLDSRKMSRRP